MPGKSRSVETFSLCLDDWGQALSAEQPVAFLERQLLARLENPARLLRWAVVRVEKDAASARFWCEGAYLKNG